MASEDMGRDLMSVNILIKKHAVSSTMCMCILYYADSASGTPKKPESTEHSAFLCYTVDSYAYIKQEFWVCSITQCIPLCVTLEKRCVCVCV